MRSARLLLLLCAFLLAPLAVVSVGCEKAPTRAPVVDTSSSSKTAPARGGASANVDPRAKQLLGGMPPTVKAGPRPVIGARVDVNDAGQ